MLKKLLKYDLKYIYKVLIIFYALVLIFALLTRIFWTFDNRPIFNILGYIASSVTISFIISTIINNIMRTWSRFVKNIYKDEAYLTHTLPIKKSIIYISKFLSSIITIFTSVLVLLLAIFIAYYSKENIELIKKSLELMSNVYNSTVINIILTIFLIFFLEISLAVQIGYTGIILGHRSNNNKLIKSIIYGFICFAITQIVVVLAIYLTGFFNSKILDLFIVGGTPTIEIIKLVLILGIILYLFILIIFYIINIKAFTKGINID